MRRLTALLAGPLAAVALATPAHAMPVDPLPAPWQSHVTLDGVRVALDPGTTQVVTTVPTGGHTARVAYWELRDGRWRRLMTVGDGRVGYGGVVPEADRRQDTGATPAGTHRLISAFGHHDRRPAWDLRYRAFDSDDYWVLDSDSPHYNRFRTGAQGGFALDDSEHLVEFGDQYEFAIVMDYNRDQTPGRGGAMFLHVNGDGATAGCVTAPRWFIRNLMDRLDPLAAPVIAVAQ